MEGVVEVVGGGGAVAQADVGGGGGSYVGAEEEKDDEDLKHKRIIRGKDLEQESSSGSKETPEGDGTVSIGGVLVARTGSGREIASKKQRTTNHLAFPSNPLLPDRPRHAPDLTTAVNVFILPLLHGAPLVTPWPPLHDQQSSPWRLAWQNFHTCSLACSSVHQSLLHFLAQDPPHSTPFLGHAVLTHDSLVHLGNRLGSSTYCALDVTPPRLIDQLNASEQSAMEESLVHSMSPVWTRPFNDLPVGFVDIGLLLVGTDWEDDETMQELSIAGYARAMVIWHVHTKFCGRCGGTTNSKEHGRLRQCENSECMKKLLPRLDPVVIVLVIDKDRDRVVLGLRSQFRPHMWTCLAGHLELGETLEEAVRRATRKKVGIEVRDTIYYGSQPWPLGPSSKPCQLLVGFFAVASTFEIIADKKELEEARWYSREQVMNALTRTEDKSEQQQAASKIHQACSGEWKKMHFAPPRIGTADTALFIPGSFAIAHDLMAAWAMNHPATILGKSSPR